MRLFEAIVEANQRAARGEDAGLRPGDFADALPIVALSCIDPRLNPLLPEVLGITEEQFIWLRNAGNIITGPLSSTMRSLALACAVKGGREIAVIGHTDCRVQQTTASQLLDRFRALGIGRSQLPDNVNEFFGLFASERTNVIKAVDFVRQSPLIGRAIPVHGLLVNIQTGALEWLVNGYRALHTEPAGPATGGLNLPGFNPGTLPFPDSKIGDLATLTNPVTPPVPPPSPLPSPPTPPEVGPRPASGLKVRPAGPIPVPPRIPRPNPKPR